VSATARVGLMFAAGALAPLTRLQFARTIMIASSA
jgi:hypothetical protein